MADEVLGDWNEFTFQLATEENIPEVAQHIRDYFLRGEIMNIFLGWREDNAENHDEMVKIALKQNTSFLVREKVTGELAAVQLIIDTRQDGFDKLLNVTSPNLKKIRGFIGKLEESTQAVFIRDFKCDFYAAVFISSVTTKCRGKGLATEIYRRTIPFLKAKGFTVLRSAFSSAATRAIGAKLGFVELGRLYFKDHQDENGEQIFPGTRDVEDYTTDVAFAL